MGFVTLFLKQTATYWKRTGTDGFGNPTYNAPITLKCRWEDRGEQITNPEGKQVLSRSRVWLDTDIKVGDWLKLGSATAADPQEDDDAFIVVDFRKVPNLDATDFERLAYL